MYRDCSLIFPSEINFEDYLLLFYLEIIGYTEFLDIYATY